MANIGAHRGRCGRAERHNSPVGRELFSTPMARPRALMYVLQQDLRTAARGFEQFPSGP